MSKRVIKLNRLETRFLFNFVVEENNKMGRLDRKNLSQLNLNNVDQSTLKYQKKMRVLKNKLEKLDKSFYE